MIHSIYMSMHASIHRDPHIYRHRQRYFAFCAHYTEPKTCIAAQINHWMALCLSTIDHGSA